MNIEIWPQDMSFEVPEGDPTPRPLHDGDGFRPHLKWMPAPDSNGLTVMVVPGGGYARRADGKAENLGRWFNELGFHVALLRYRVSPWRFPAPQQDALRAIRTLRHRSEELGLNPEGILVLGKSAGGHLATSMATFHSAIQVAVGDEVDTLNGRPDRLMLIYPVISMVNHCHMGSVDHLLGKKPGWADRAGLSLERCVGPDHPPTFLFATVDDATVPIANTYALATALADAGVDHEVHTFPVGGHGWTMDPKDGEPWFGAFRERLVEWLARQGS